MIIFDLRIAYAIDENIATKVVSFGIFSSKLERGENKKFHSNDKIYFPRYITLFFP